MTNVMRLYAKVVGASVVLIGLRSGWSSVTSRSSVS